MKVAADSNPAPPMSSAPEVLNPDDHTLADRRTVTAIVPARLASTRLPNKMLLDLGGAPLIVRVCENLLASRVFARVVVAADSSRVADVARAAGLEVVVTDPDLASGTDRVAACAKTLGLGPEALVVNVQGDEPFASAALLLRVTSALRGAGRDIVTACAPYRAPAGAADPNVVKVVRGVGDRALYFSRASVPYVRDPDDAPAVPLARHVGVYAFRADVLAEVAALPPHPIEQLERLEQLRWLAHGYGIRAMMVEEPGAFGIDTAADLARANERFRR